MIVANGSNDEYKSRYAETIKSVQNILPVEHRLYDANFPFFDRILDVLEDLNDDYVIMGADDDYPIMDVLDKGEAFLNANLDYSTAMGSIIHMKLDGNGKLSARLGHARSLSQPNAAIRAREFAKWPFSTTYAITRRDHLIERYKRARTTFLANFFDFTLGIHDCMVGKFKAFGDIGYFCSRNARHSYLRADDPLIYLRRSEEVLNLVDVYQDDLVNYAKLSQEAAKKQATRLIRHRIEHLASMQPHSREGFAATGLFKDPIIQQQYSEFHGLFEKGQPIRETRIEQLRYIVNGLREQAIETIDNKNEKQTYETLNQQIASKPPLT